MEDLLKRIIVADKAYYTDSCPTISDQEYDALKELLRSQEPNHPIFDKVGHAPSPLWQKASHNISMGSLNKVHNGEDFLKWSTKFNQEIFTIQPKLDGLSVSLIYENSEFKQGITRGDGNEGENITPNVLRMQGLIKNIPGYNGSIRAEIVLPKDDFIKINQILSSDDQYSNARNAAAGISRRLDGQYCKYLMLMPYDLTQDVPINENEKLYKLKSMGFNTPNQTVGTSDVITEAFKKLKEDRESFNYDIDGAVIKVCSHQIQTDSGLVNNRPKAQIAWKFDPPGAITKFIKEIWDVGRTGVVTPLALLEPVNIDGSIISRATLHNLAEISRLNISRGDTVMLVKAGDIIPKITSVIEHTGIDIIIPEKCPSCGSKLKNDNIKLMCLNDLCPKKVFNRILYWIKVTKIDSFGESLVEALGNKINKIADIYKLTKEDIKNTEGWGDLSADKIINSINVSKNLEPAVFLSAVGIPTLSDKTAEELLNNFKTIDNLFKASIDDIKVIHGFSDISATAIVVGLKKYESEIKELLTVINLTKTNGGGVLSGKSFVFTGALSKPRSYYQDLVKKNGGKNGSSVTKDLSYLVCNENVGSSKSKKAQQLSIPTITEQEFITMIGPGNLTEAQPPKPKVENVSLF